MRNTKKRGRGAFTLVESMVASTILAVAVIGLVGPLTASSQQSEVMAQSSMALSLGRQLINEIASKPYTEPNGTIATGPQSGQTSRGQYDSIGDYNGYSDSTTAMKAVDGTSLSFGLGNDMYTRSVSVQYVKSPGGAAAGTTSNYALVTVTVTPPAGPSVQLSRFITNATQKWQ